MPRLHRYQDRAGAFVRANIKRQVVTYQLTPEGEDKLVNAGVAVGIDFPLRQLLLLIRTGDAFTGRSGTAVPPPDAEGQTMMAFSGDAEAEDLIPRCTETKSLHDLHLVAYETGGAIVAALLSPEPRFLLQRQTTLSVPLGMLDLKRLGQLETSGKLPLVSEAVKQLRRWLKHDLDSIWKARSQKHRQDSLHLDPSADGLPLEGS